ncbi:MAG: DUF2507 domain-containing protein [Clostridia bacterium]
MQTELDPFHSLISPILLPHLEQATMPYTGYHLLRETVFSRLLGESEASILYWLGRDLGKELPIRSTDELTLSFIRLGLGKLEAVHQEEDRSICYRLSHPLYPFHPLERLQRSLAFECGLVAGSLGRAQGKPIHARLDVRCTGDGKPSHALITASDEYAC